MSNLSKKEFRELLITPLEIEFNTKVYWNGKESMQAGFSKINELGTCFFEDGGAIVLQFSKNRETVFTTFIHELAHFVLHEKLQDDEISEIEGEIEAESVVKELYRLLNLDFRKSHNYIKGYQEDYWNMNNGKTYEYDYEKIESLALKIFKVYKREKVLRAIKDMHKEFKSLKGLRVSQPFKYEVICPCCEKRIGRYKNRNSSVFKSPEECYCGNCGDKTKGKLLIREIKNA